MNAETFRTNMIDKSLIQRMGFEAFADNVFVNAMEDYIVGDGSVGNMSFEGKDMSCNMEWNVESISFNLRAYTSEGWKEYSKQIKR